MKRPIAVKGFVCIKSVTYYADGKKTIQWEQIPRVKIINSKTMQKLKGVK
jgi:hypothetical protein